MGLFCMPVLLCAELLLLHHLAWNSILVMICPYSLPHPYICLEDAIISSLCLSCLVAFKIFSLIFDFQEFYCDVLGCGFHYNHFARVSQNVFSFWIFVYQLENYW